MVASGALSFEDGVRLVVERGEAMQLAAEEHPGTMAAVLGLDASEQPQPGVAAEFFETGFGGRMAEQDCQEEDAPQGADGAIVAAAVAAGLKGRPQRRIGDRLEGLAKGAEAGRGLHLVQGEERLADVDDHGEFSGGGVSPRRCARSARAMGGVG